MGREMDEEFELAHLVCPRAEKVSETGEESEVVDADDWRE